MRGWGSFSKPDSRSQALTQPTPEPVPRRKFSGEESAGLFYGVAAFLVWSFTPFYFNALDGLRVEEIVAHRIVWCAVFLIPVLTVSGQWPAVWRALRTPKVLGILFVTAAVNSLNWGVFIYSVVSDQLLASSLGYFLNPLVNVFLGFVFLSERFTRMQKVAVALAAIGVMTQIIGFGEFPWIALTIAFAFGFYGLLRKTVDAGAPVGLFVECLLISPFALGWLIWLDIQGLGAFGQSGLGYDAFLALAGVITGIPLVLFAAGARRIKLATIGLLQYISPSVYLIMALTIWKEPFETADFVTFGCIWLALILYTREIWRTREV